MSVPVKVRGSIAEVTVETIVHFLFASGLPPRGGGIRLSPRGGRAVARERNNARKKWRGREQDRNATGSCEPGGWNGPLQARLQRDLMTPRGGNLRRCPPRGGKPLANKK